MPLSRRKFLALTGAVAATTGMSPAAAAKALQTPSTQAAANAAEWTTLTQRLGPGAAGTLGYRPVVALSGEPHTVRGTIAAPLEGRESRRHALLTFVHLTDQHIIDAQSPSRVEFTDRYANGDCPVDYVTSAHRPQEAASARIADAMLQRLRKIGVSPVTGRAISATISTGDNTDNQQANELSVFLGVMDGGRVKANSGDPAKYEGVQSSGSTEYWHPDPAVNDIYKSAWGFPARAGFLEQALAEFDAVGAGVPWYTCFGNHDGLAQGNAPVNPIFEGIGTGPVKVVGAPPGAAPCPPQSPAPPAPGAQVMPTTPDPERRYVLRQEWIKGHLDSPGLPKGHGFKKANLDQNVAYYTAEHGRVRWIVLDTVNPGGYAEGSIGDTQLQWLDAELAKAQADRKYVMLFSHHGPRSLENPLQDPDPLREPGFSDLPRHMADEVLAVVDKYTCVIAWVNGHTHDNVITPRGRWWDIGTAAHIDWPCQSRIIDVVDNRDGTLSIFTTMFDHEDTPIAAFARELAGNDPQAGFATGMGKPEDRNTELLLANPFAAAGADGGSATPQAELMLPATGLPANLSLGGALAVAASLGVAKLRMEAARRT
jgi:metallophosphoesterase (TIGR03767 family)